LNDTNGNRDGGYVHDASCGLYRNCLEADNSSEYPAIMLTFNIDPSRRISKFEVEKNKEKYEGKVFVTPRGNYYLKLPIGVIPEILINLIRRRDFLKDELKRMGIEGKFGTPEYKQKEEESDALKSLINSFFGTIGAEDENLFRFRDVESFGDITCIGRLHERWNIRIIKDEFGAIIIYGDTDSVKFILPGITILKDLIEMGFEITTKLNASYLEMLKPFGIETHYLNVKFVGIFDFLQWNAKKNYVQCWLYKDGKILTDLPIKERLEVKGSKSIRSDASAYTKKMLDDFFELVFVNGEIVELKKFVLYQESFFRKRLIPIEELHRPIGLKKRLTSYARGRTPVQIRAMTFSNEHLGKHFKGGDKILYCWGNAIDATTGQILSDVWAIEYGDRLDRLSEKFNIIFAPDWDRLMKNNLVKPLFGDKKGKTKGPMNAFGISWDEILMGYKQASLFSFGE